MITRESPAQALAFSNAVHIVRETRVEKPTGRRVVCWTYVGPSEQLGELAERPLEFSPWEKWNDWVKKSEFDCHGFGGGYLFGHFKHAPRQVELWSHLPQEIVYVGETKNLILRLKNHRPDQALRRNVSR